MVPFYMRGYFYGIWLSRHGWKAAVTGNLQIKIDLAKIFMPYSTTVFLGLLGCEIP